jgi:hypothetical protein
MKWDGIEITIHRIFRNRRNVSFHFSSSEQFAEWGERHDLALYHQTVADPFRKELFSASEKSQPGFATPHQNDSNHIPAQNNGAQRNY